MFKYGFQAFNVCIYSLLPQTTDKKTITPLNALQYTLIEKPDKERPWGMTQMYCKI